MLQSVESMIWFCPVFQEALSTDAELSGADIYIPVS